MLCFFIPVTSLSQILEKRLESWSQQNPIEKLYLHIDRENYYAGETVWAKGYFMSEYLPSTSSSNLCVELLNSRSELILRNIFPVYGGMALAQLELPDSLDTGTYLVHAYSPQMLNQPGFTFNRTISVSGKANRNQKTDDKNKKSSLHFFPEGGNFINGVLNTVAFKSVDPNGLPVPAEGEIRNNKNELVCRFNSCHDGMGMFTMAPVKGETYYATTNLSDQKYSLPLATDDGIVFNITDASGIKRFKIIQGGENEIYKPAYLVGQVQNIIIFKQPLQNDKREISGAIRTSELGSGILQLTVFNKDNIPLAERITFVDNKEYVLPFELIVDTLNSDKRKRNRFTIGLNDTLIGSFSVSVTDADFETEPNRPANIYSQFLLTSDIRGYVHNPAYYFNNASDSARQALELVMMTNGWTRFKWSELAENKLVKPHFKDPGFISLSGKVNIAGTKKPVKDKDILLLLTPADTSGIGNTRSMLIHTDHTGRFSIDSLIFYGKTKLTFSEVSGKKNDFIGVHLDQDALTRNFTNSIAPVPVPEQMNSVVDRRLETDYTEMINAKGQMLEAVTVQAIRRSPLDQLDRDYASGYFSSAVHSTRLDLRNEPYGGDLFQYLRERIPGLKIISGENGGYVLNFRGGNLEYFATNGDAGTPDYQKDDPRSNTGNVTLFLNEMQTDYTNIEGVPFTEIALVKFFPTSTAAPGGGAALAVYTKKGNDSFPKTEAPTEIISYQGYTVVKEFYNPDYDNYPANDLSDRRITLTWEPDIIVNGVNTRVPVSFYNNDRTRRFKVVAEGITSDGRMLMIEKIIEPGK